MLVYKRVIVYFQYQFVYQYYYLEGASWRKVPFYLPLSKTMSQNCCFDLVEFHQVPYA